MFWRIDSFPKCRFHVFISHAAEDRAWLVEPLCERLKADGTIPWFDRHHYPAGTDPYEALRSGILECRFIVYLITLATLANSRGWQSIEKGYGGILQDCFRVPGGELSRVELPLFFVPRTHAVLNRSVWQSTISRGQFHDSGATSAVEWATNMIARFRRREEVRGAVIGAAVAADPVLNSFVGNWRGMSDRITAAFP